MAIIGRDLQVRRATVLTYTAERGADIQMPKFTRQFTGKGPKDPIRVGKDIDAITGATLSAKAMSGGVRDAIRLVRELAASSQ
jgi:Na+-translocating ferredoxin:NAD+ oxidoreductase RnfG subunit